MTSPNLLPENIAYLRMTDRFYVGSLRYGRASSVDANGKLTTLCDDLRLISTFGIFTKQARGLVQAEAPWSAVRDAAHSSAIAALEVDTGSRAGGYFRITLTSCDFRERRRAHAV